MIIEQTDALKPRTWEIGLLPMAEPELERAKCVMCQQVRPICCAQYINGLIRGARCDQCCRHCEE